MDRDDDAGVPAELTRRQVMRRAAGVGGALVWTVPVVQSMSGTAVAATPSPVAVEGEKAARPKPGTAVEAGSDDLASTGSQLGDIAALGAGALAAGAALRAVAKRRRTERGDAGGAAPS